MKLRPTKVASTPVRDPKIIVHPTRRIAVDLFAGGGGASEGFKMATGRDPDVAVNHNPIAIGMHKANHPNCRHFIEDVRKVDPIDACSFDAMLCAVDSLWLSPDCTHFSKARGGKPVEKGIRSLAEVLIDWLDALAPYDCHPRLILLENVEEFKDWGPVLENGKPCPENKGIDFRRFVKNIERHGYKVEWRELIAAQAGAPTTRKRLYLMARRDGQRIRWPAARFHSAKDLREMPLLDLTLWRSAASIIDWGVEIPSIFSRKRPLKPKTLRRIARGVDRFVVNSGNPFIVPVTHTSDKSGNAAMPSTEPLRTATAAKGGEFALAAPTIVPLTHDGGESRVYDPLDPMRSVTGANRGEMGLAVPTLIPRYGEREGQEPRVLSADGPYPTPVPGGNGGDLAATFLQKMAENGIGTPITGPLDTAMAGATKHYQVAAHLAREFGTGVGSDPSNPAPTVMPDGGGKTKVVASHLTRMAKGQVGSDATEPVKTGTSHAKDGIVAASMLQHNGDRVGRPADEPVTALTERSTQQQLMAVSLDSYYRTSAPASPTDPTKTITERDRICVQAAYMEQANTGMVGHDMRSPVSTIMGKGCTQRLVEMGLMPVDSPETSTRAHVLDLLWNEFGAPTEEEWADPTATSQSRLRFGLVILDGAVWMIVDIGMRMLTPRELFSAQGFRRDYIIDRTDEGKPITKTAQTAAAGNSVCPPMAEDLYRENLTWLELPARMAA
ncbi:methyltransferase [Caulobacter phage Sansa]|uniref:DNA (cytosine-5-)-methyltransferase n=1 Tax=Caulobacter phage Sansa TaxID=1675600 RepID=A0A0K1LMQ3_9CAUD|nr:DNA methyltransferase [Caulobacter phage Sansa]AKU43483.1 methyltransferase [Caulobacter phage Sansa]